MYEMIIRRDVVTYGRDILKDDGIFEKRNRRYTGDEETVRKRKTLH